MMGRLKHIWILLLLLTGLSLNAHAQKRNNLVMAEDHLILLLDLHSPDHTLDSLLQTAGVDKPDVKALKSGKYSSLEKQGWNVLPVKGGLLRIDRSMADINTGKSFLVTATPGRARKRAGYPLETLFGVNKFGRVNVHELENGLTRFFLPGYQDEKRVVLSGSFNNWSTLQGLMLKTDSGWIKDIRLEPGAYEYKYIIGSRWQYDQDNILREHDGVGGYNSVYYRYNFRFFLPGYSHAHRVVVAGSFNGWNAGEPIMSEVPGGWALNLYLHDGVHLYRFLVDGRPVTDPANKEVHKDDTGGRNSVLNIGETINFKLDGYENAREVYLAGNFNGWKPHQLAMVKEGNTWVFPGTFPAGNYQYKFVVDGGWKQDPANPHQAVEGGVVNSFVSVKPNHTFVLKGYSDAGSVHLSGNFNNWNPFGYTMEHRGDEWVISVRLQPGKCLYKFVVDGKWILDPDNKLWEQNQQRTGNSVFWVDN